MFIEALKKQNPKLIDAAIQFWKQGEILPDSYVIDVDQIIDNGSKLLATAQANGIELYVMTKQIGRNQFLAKKLIDIGYRGVVAVDFKEAAILNKYQIPLCHLGHLVQIPDGMINQMLQADPDVITIFSLEKAKKISEMAIALNRIQPILLKFIRKGDNLYPGQEAGFDFDKIEQIVAEIKQLLGIKIVGVTHFPCLLWNEEQQKIQITPNLQTLVASAKKLKELGVSVQQINGPSASSVSSLPLLAQYGITHTEPGHALTGTVPSNQLGSQPEKIAMVYLTEVSHQVEGNTYCFGGGHYRRGHAHNALVWTAENQYQNASILPLDVSSIDYHIPLAGKFPVGSPVVMCFRTQIFVTRSDVVLISGLSQGKPKLEGIYNSQGEWKKESYLG